MQHKGKRRGNYWNRLRQSDVIARILPLMKIAAGVEYDGSKYSGWQRQKLSVSVQQHVEAALSAVADHPLSVTCAGRTDAGVHALNQVIHFESDAVRDAHSWVFGSNTHLPGDISLTWAKPVQADFHARYSATSRIYNYIILNRPARPGLGHGSVTWECRRLDSGRMSRAALSLVGEHDFTSYRAKSCQAKTPVRNVLDLSVKRDNEYVVIVVEANAFLHHMVRNIAGVLMEIGISKHEVGWELDVLNAKSRDCGGVTAAADGLYLTGVNYPEKYGIPQQQTDRYSDYYL